jgi:hypothetical protein
VTPHGGSCRGACDLFVEFIALAGLGVREDLFDCAQVLLLLGVLSRVVNPVQEMDIALRCWLLTVADPPSLVK